MSAQDRGWGGPGLTRSQTVKIPVPGIQLNVRREVEALFIELVRWLTLERQRTGVPALSSVGGYIKRVISGTSTWSNHSWGLAADFNAATNPYARNGGTDMPPGTSEKAKSLGMRWGGDYAGKRDAMHFEFIGTPADATRLVAELARARRTPTPVVSKPNPSEEDTVTPEDRSAIAADTAARVVRDLGGPRRQDGKDTNSLIISLGDILNAVDKLSRNLGGARRQDGIDTDSRFISNGDVLNSIDRVADEITLLKAQLAALLAKP